MGSWNFRNHFDYYSRGGGVGNGKQFFVSGDLSTVVFFSPGCFEGYKIVAGLIPFFILAGMIESFITRYADEYPWVGGGCILLSLVGVIAYFAIYPWKIEFNLGKSRNTNGKN